MITSLKTSLLHVFHFFFLLLFLSQFKILAWIILFTYIIWQLFFTMGWFLAYIWSFMLIALFGVFQLLATAAYRLQLEVLEFFELLVSLHFHQISKLSLWFLLFSSAIVIEIVICEEFLFVHCIAAIFIFVLLTWCRHVLMNGFFLLYILRFIYHFRRNILNVAIANKWIFGWYFYNIQLLFLLNLLAVLKRADLRSRKINTMVLP